MRRLSLVILSTLAIVLLLPNVAKAQDAMSPYKFDIGAGLGMSGYIGDANSGNPFKHAGFTADISSRYIIDSRWALRASLSMIGLSGSTDDIENVLPYDERFEFTSNVYDFTVRGEFNFFAFGIGESYKRLRRLSPYLALGIGLSLSSSDGNTAIAPTMPMAFGIKFKLNERINLMGEFSMTKVFSDHVDGADIADLNHIETKFYKNTDWFSRLSVGISYEFGERCETCHYVD